ncbi:hypothetical protein HYU19_02165 [Candidatus Woesearchaeota archaeon]|nr:hypothetical protein [Candidatus Woesearchaeota archaeon]
MEGITIKRFRVHQLPDKEDVLPFDIYTEYNSVFGADEECDNDEVSPAEAGFMRGYINA